jgi:hypothetical protein
LQHFSLFEYCYRDAANNKAWGSLLLKGFASSAAIEELQRHFEAQVFFIAEQLNIPPLYSELWAFSHGPTCEDHVWHTFHALRPAGMQEVKGPVFNTVDAFVQAVRTIRAWDEKLSPHWRV